MNKSFSILLLCMFSLSSFSACDNGPHHSDRSDTETAETSLAFVESSTGLPVQGQWREGIAFYDMNRDGRLDILAPAPRKAAKSEQRPFIWFGNGKGEWALSAPTIPMDIAYDYGDIAAGDFTGDGIPDIALAIHGAGLKGLKGKGNGTYTHFSKGLPPVEGFASRALVSADFNHDGIEDIAAVSEGRFGKKEIGARKGAMLCLGSKDEWYSRLIGVEKETLGLFADKIITGDVNGDGNVDIGIASLQHRRISSFGLATGRGALRLLIRGYPLNFITGQLRLLI